MSLVPADCSNKDKIPFLKIGEDIGKRVTIFNEKGIIVEDVADFDGAVIRRLFFESRIEQVQSEVNLREVPITKEIEPLMTQSSLFKPDAKKTVVINHRVLCSDYARSMVASFAAISNLIITKPILKVIVLGTGAGVFSSFIKLNIPTSIVNTVDIDPAIVEVILD